MTLTVKVYTTSEWGAVSPRSTPKLFPHGSYIIIHHTAGTPSSGGTVAGGMNLARAIQKDHMKRVTKSGTKWIDSGHNFLNTIGGHLFEGRHRTIEAINKGKCVNSAHSDQGAANKCPGIENEGNYMTKKMPKAQWDALVALCVDLCINLNLDPSVIRGHRDFAATKCPGDWLYAALPQLIADVRANMPS